MSVLVIVVICTSDDISLNKCYNFYRHDFVNLIKISQGVFDDTQPYATSRKTVYHNMTSPQLQTSELAVFAVILLTTETEIFININRYN